MSNEQLGVDIAEELCIVDIRQKVDRVIRHNYVIGVKNNLRK